MARKTPEWVRQAADAAEIRARKQREAKEGKKSLPRVKLKPKPAPKLKKDGTPAEKRGPKSRFRKEYVAIVERLFATGLTDSEVARSLSIGTRTLYHWASEHPELLHSMRLGKQSDERVKLAAFKLACGYSRNGVYYPPNVSAIRFWLRNRCREEFPDRVEMTGKGGGPIQQQVVQFDPAQLAHLTDKEVAVLEKALAKMRPVDSATPAEPAKLESPQELKRKMQEQAKLYESTVH